MTLNSFLQISFELSYNDFSNCGAQPAVLKRPVSVNGVARKKKFRGRMDGGDPRRPLSGPLGIKEKISRF